MTITPESIDVPAEDRKPVGSVFIIQAKSLDEVRKMMEEDIYYTSGVVSLPYARSTWLS